MTYPGGVSRPTHPGSMSHGLAWNVVVVESVDPTNNVALCRDQLTKPITMPLNSMRAKGLPPAVGEQWIITKEYGGWSFALLLNGKPGGEQVPMANVEGLSDLDANAQVGAARGDSQLFGDVISTMHRREITTDITGVNNNALFAYRTYTDREITAHVLKMAIGNTARVGGSHYFGIHVGPDTENLPQKAYTSNFPSTVAKAIPSWDIGSTITIPAGSHIVFWSLIIGATTLPSFAGRTVLAPAFVNRGAAFYTAAWKGNVTSPPETIDFTDGTWTTTASIAWAAFSTF